MEWPGARRTELACGILGKSSGKSHPTGGWRHRIAIFVRVYNFNREAFFATQKNQQQMQPLGSKTRPMDFGKNVSKKLFIGIYFVIFYIDMHRKLIFAGLLHCKYFFPLR